MIVEEGIAASVIMIGYNGRGLLGSSLPSLVQQAMPAGSFEILYIDNASSDGSADYVETAFPDVSVTRLRKNVGFYAAFNWAAERLARGRHVVALPQDALLHESWLAELVRTAETVDNALVCVTNTVPPASPDYSTRPLAGQISTLTRSSVSRLGHVRVRTVPFSAGARPTLAATGVSGLLSRDLVRRAGGLFDPTFGHYAADVELGLRATCVGGRVVQAPSAIVYHIGEPHRSLRDPALLRRFAAGSRDQILVYWKHMTTLEFILFLPLLTVGLAAKSFELRCRRVTSVSLFFISLLLAPAVVLAACAEMPRHRTARSRMLRLRTLSRFGLLRLILGGENQLPPLAVRERDKIGGTT